MTNPTNLSQLIGDADLGAAATSAMQLTADNLGPAVAAALGSITLDDITTAEVVLVTVLLDDSGSIRFAGNTQAVRDGHNGMGDALKGGKQSASVLMCCRYLNNGVLYPYVMLDGVVQLDASNYNPGGGTPLYQETAVALTSVAAKMAEFEQGGVAARAVTVIVTDGGDDSGRPAPASLKAMVEGSLRTEQHIIIGMGIQDPGVDFRQVFQSMGILDEWILTPGNTASEVRRAFQVVSQSAVRASQTVGSFSQVAMGGFGP